MEEDEEAGAPHKASSLDFWAMDDNEVVGSFFLALVTPVEAVLHRLEKASAPPDDLAAAGLEAAPRPVEEADAGVDAPPRPEPPRAGVEELMPPELLWKEEKAA